MLEGAAGATNRLSAAFFALAWPSSNLNGEVVVNLAAGQSLADALANEWWSPRWLLDAGYKARDAAGLPLVNDNAAATASGPIAWDPIVRLPRVDDGIKDTAPADKKRIRVAGEVALAALWKKASTNAMDAARPATLSRQERGKVFAESLNHVLDRLLPAPWQVEPELPLAKIRGLHMRSDVGTRKGDVVVVDDRKAVVALLSAKWSWRSDRGTEAAQMMTLRRYRSDIPYLLVTAEFVRASAVVRESAEDAVYHVSPTWVGAWRSIRDSVSPPPTSWPKLADLQAEGAKRAASLGLAKRDVRGLARDLRESARYL